MTLLAERSGRLLEHTSNDVPRGMTVHDRTRLTVRAVYPHTAAGFKNLPHFYKNKKAV